MEEYKLEENPARPKYLLLSDGINKQIVDGHLVLGQKIPSVNKLSEEYNYSRETVFKALAHLREKGILKAVDKIGYFVSDVSRETEFRVFLMLDRFTVFKEDLYNSFLEKLGKKAKVSLYFHHENVEIFESLILQNIKNYTHFVIATYIKESDTLYDVLDKIPPEKLILIDKYEKNLAKGYGMVYQDFRNDIFNTLSNNVNLVKKYKKLILIHHENDLHGDFIKSGFSRFCEEYNFHGEVHNKFFKKHFHQSNLYITIDLYDRDLVEIIKLVRKKEWKLGNQIGVVSYNDTPTKEILDGGITVISTDFKKMGEDAAIMILENKFEHKPNKSKFIVRNSF